MAKTYRWYEPDQLFLMPPSLREWLPEDHLAYFVSELVDDLDLSEIEAVYEDEERGQPPYHPRMMTKVLIYAYCNGIFASRRIEKRLIEDVAFRVLAAGNTPDFRTLSDFRKIHRQAVEGLFEQVLRLALKAGAMKLGRVAIDGSKVKANASKHKAMSYGRMKERERELREEVRRMLSEADRQDEAEDRRYGKDRRGEELPEELRRRESRLERIREAKRALEEEARQEAQEASKEVAKPEDKKQYNFTDPQSRILKESDGFVQGYNRQIAVEENFQLIVGQAVTQQANDKEQLKPMVEAIQEQAGQKPGEVLADSATAMESPLISCIIPVYNGERYLGESIDSVLGQTYRTIELIVIDDGSSDGTAEVLACYGERIRCARQARVGHVAARNHGISLAQGEFIAFQDADDVWHSEKLERQMARFLARPELDLCIAHVENFWIAELQAEAERFHNHRLTRPVPGYVMQALLVRRALIDRIGPLNSAWGHAADREFFLRAAEQGAVMELLPDVLVHRRLHHSNFSRQVSASIDDHLRVIKASLDRRRRGGTNPQAYEFPGSDLAAPGKETASTHTRSSSTEPERTKEHF